MFNTFNMGLGMTVVVAPGEVKKAIALLAARGVTAWDVGHIEAGKAGAGDRGIKKAPLRCFFCAETSACHGVGRASVIFAQEPGE